MKLHKDLGIIEEKGRKTKYGIYVCPYCRSKFKARTNNIRSGNTTKCRDCAIKLNITKHGDSLKKSPYYRLYIIWRDMIKRCHNKKTRCFHNYGGRGITVCKEWQNYGSFKKWAIQNGYKNNLTIDRTNNNKGYCHENCKWSTMSDQVANERKREGTKSKYIGVYFEKNRGLWLVQIKYKGERHHIGRFKLEIEAVNARNLFIIENNFPHTLNNYTEE